MWDYINSRSLTFYFLSFRFPDQGNMSSLPEKGVSLKGNTFNGYYRSKGCKLKIQSTLVISKSKRPSETLRDIRTSKYQICRTEENTN